MSLAKVVLVGVPGMNDEEIEKIEKYIKEEVEDIDFVFLGKGVLPKDELIEKCKDVDVLVTWNQQMDMEVYKALSLKAFCAASTGFNAADIESATKCGVMVTNAKDYCVDEVSSHALMLILTFARKLNLAVENVKNGKWNIEGMGRISRFSDSTVGLFAFGSIARGVAKKLSGFGLKMISYDPYVDEDVMREYGVKKVDFDTLLKSSDYISIHAPLTKETYKIFSKEKLSQVKEGAYIINTARGQIIDQDALYEMLESGRIQGAGLDVIFNEPPLDTDLKLINLPNTIVTPHSAYYSDEAQEDQLRITARDVGRIIRGEVPFNLRNPEVLESSKGN